MLKYPGNYLIIHWLAQGKVIAGRLSGLGSSQEEKLDSDGDRVRTPSKMKAEISVMLPQAKKGRRLQATDQC